MPTATPDVLVTWVLGLGAFVGLVSAILGAALLVKKLTERRPLKDQYVERSEIDSLKSSLKEEFDKVKENQSQFTTKAEMTELKVVLKDLENYVRDRLHNLADKLSPLATAVAVISKQHDRLETKLDQMTLRQEHLIISSRAVKLEERLKTPPEETANGG